MSTAFARVPSWFVAFTTAALTSVSAACTAFTSTCEATHTCAVVPSPDAAAGTDAGQLSGLASGGSGGTGSGIFPTASGGNGSARIASPGDGDSPAPARGSIDADGGREPAGGNHVDAGPAPPNGAGDDAGIQCPTGLADCNGSRADGCEVPLAASATNCGQCGRDCKGGACIAGECQPLTLVSGLAFAGDLVADASFVHFVDRGSTTAYQLKRVPAAGGAVTQIVDNEAIRSVATDGTHVYWTLAGSSSGNIDRTLSGSGPNDVNLIMSEIKSPGVVGADPLNVFWADDDMSTIYRCGPTTNPNQFCNPVPVLDKTGGVASLLSDGTTLYASGDAVLYAVDLTTRSVAMLVENPGTDLQPSFARLAMDATHVYAWFESKTIGDRPGNHILRFDKPTLANPVDLVNVTFKTASLEVIGSYAYFTQPDGVYRIPTTAPGEMSNVAVSFAQYLTAAAGAVYWIEAGAGIGAPSSIKKIAVF
ncbi:MAG TPA: hypothetical protein VH062_24830 [Polyangiaceae bacterium]|nr:hypothetical protein [Polyangiaceae bacterium]